MAERATVDFDHHSHEFHEARHARWADLRRCPVAHNPRYGGFWVVSGYEEVAAVARDTETFSSLHRRSGNSGDPAEDGLDYLGIAGIPRSRTIPTAGIAEVEGALHGAIRRALNPFLVPAAIARMEPRMEQAATACLDRHSPTGAIDLVLDYASPVPAAMTMDLVGLPLDNAHRYAELFHDVVAFRPGDEEFERAVTNLPDLIAELHREVAAHRDQPGDDLISRLVEVEVEGRGRLTEEELVAVVWNLVAGGLDTTTSLTSLTLYHLDQQPRLRQQLIDDPGLLDPATEEFLRYFSVNETLTRTVTRDVELGGQPLGRGDHLMLSWLSANRDEATFDRADEVVLDRESNPHLAFGVGPHRCIGMHMARSLFKVLIRQVLARIPDYTVIQEATQFYAGNPELNGVVRMPATFTPGS